VIALLPVMYLVVALLITGLNFHAAGRDVSGQRLSFWLFIGQFTLCLAGGILWPIECLVFTFLALTDNLL
jgi:hypothetical protein